MEKKREQELSVLEVLRLHREFHLLPLVAVSRCTTGFSANR